MGRWHTVRAGDCISSIAFEGGLLPEQVWNAAENGELRATREHGNCLAEGDRVFVPELTVKEVSAATSATHRFVRRAVPESLRVRLLDCDGKPRVGLAFRLEVDGQTREGTTSSDGFVISWIPPVAERATLTIVDGEQSEAYRLELGNLPPVADLKGVQGRLSNLGYPCLDERGELGDTTKLRLREFQQDHDLPVTGAPDEQTREALRRIYGA